MANQKIQDIEGIGPATGDKLRAAGVTDTDTLLAKSGTPGTRKALADVSGLSEAQVLKFANIADLYRVEGIGSEFSELLEAAGEDSVPALARRNAANLAQALTKTNEEKKLTRGVPTEQEWRAGSRRRRGCRGRWSTEHTPRCGAPRRSGGCAQATCSGRSAPACPSSDRPATCSVCVGNAISAPRLAMISPTFSSTSCFTP